MKKGLLIFFCATVTVAAAGFTPLEQLQELKRLLQETPRLALERGPFPIKAPNEGWSLGTVSSALVGRDDVVYVFQRGNKADPIIALDSEGHVLRSWGEGQFKIPHSIRIDAEGNFWTVDSGNSVVTKFSAKADKLLEINLGDYPKTADCEGSLCGATDIAFGPNGRLFIADGYRNARIVEYTADGKLVRQWGSQGSGPGQFSLPHGIVFNGGILYVADRENNRVQRFDLDGRFLGEWTHLGKPYSLQWWGDVLWVGTGVPNETSAGPGTRPPGWLLKVDPSTGRILAQIESNRAHHFIDVTRTGELLGGSAPEGGFSWFRHAR